MRIRNAALIVSACALLTSPVLGADDLDQVIEKLAAKHDKYKSVQFKNITKSSFESQGISFKSDADMSMEYMRTSPDGWKLRTETKSKSSQKMQDEETKMEGNMLMIYDGEFSYTLTDMAGQKMAMKSKPEKKDNLNPFDQKALFKFQREHFELKLLPEEKVDGKAVYVIELKPKKSANPQMNMIGRSVGYYDKESGIALKAMSFDANGKEMASSITRDIKLNEDIKPERFVFKAPEGVTVVDQDALARQAEPTEPAETAGDDDVKVEEKPKPQEKQETASAKEPEKKEQPKEEPKQEEKKKSPIGGILNKLK